MADLHLKIDHRILLYYCEGTHLVPNKLLKQAREWRNWTQHKVALEIGTTAINVSRWERGLTFPGPYFRQKLCELFEKSPAELGLLREEAGVAHLSEADPVVSQIVEVYDPSIPDLPTAPAGLVGRDELLARLRLLLSANRGAFALSGLPGVGKTALVTALVHDHQLQSHFRDGMLWAGPGSHPHLVGLLARWGALLGLPQSEMTRLSSLDSWGRAIRDAIGLRRMLLVIDDTWRIEDALACKVGGPNCTYLLTTRFPELAYLFAREHALALHELSDADSLELLRQLVPDLSAGEPQELQELVRAVGGLPLALSLIGRYLQVQLHSGQPRRLRAALERLRDADARLHLEEARPPAAVSPALPSGSALSLRAVIEVSDRQLSPQARQTLRTLAVFPAKPNTFSEEAALAVSATGSEALDELFGAGLLESSLPDRYMLHQVIADYARLQAADDPPQAVARMVQYFITYVEVQQQTYDYATLALDCENVLAALHAAFRYGMTGELIRGVLAFAPFMVMTGLAAAEEHLQRAREAAQAIGDESSLAAILLHLGQVAALREDRQEAERLFEEGLAVARSAGRRDIMCALLARWGSLIVNSGDYPRAEHYLREGVKLARELDDRRTLGLLYRNLGEVADCRGDFAQGSALYEQGLALARAVDDRENMSALLQNLGVKAEGRGDYERAAQLYQEGLRLARALGHRQRISALLMNMGMLAFERRRYQEAEKLYGESLELARQIGHRPRIAAVLQNLGMLERTRGRLRQAGGYLREGLELARQIEHPWLIAETLLQWGELALQERCPREARAAFEEACSIAERISARALCYAALYGLGRTAALCEDLEAARRYGSESLALATALGDREAGEIADWLAALPAAPAETTGAPEGRG
jgi:tetratricopeptide (TPR) repeat protein/transcriptional regulator with XRE-family HTH domain